MLCNFFYHVSAQISESPLTDSIFLFNSLIILFLLSLKHEWEHIYLLFCVWINCSIQLNSKHPSIYKSIHTPSHPSINPPSINTSFRTLSLTRFACCFFIIKCRYFTVKALFIVWPWKYYYYGKFNIYLQIIFSIYNIITSITL